MSDSANTTDKSISIPENQLLIFEAIFDGISDAIIFTDVTRRIVSINRRVKSIFGYDLDDLRGKTTSILYESEKEYERQGKERFNLNAEEKSKPYLVNYCRRDGSVFTGETIGTVIKNSDGTLLGYIGVIRDVTDRQKVEELNARLGRIVENSINEVYVFNSETLNFVLVNRGARENLGYSSEELAKRTPMDIKPEFTRDIFEELLEPLRNGTKEQISFEAAHQRKDGSTYPVEIRLQLIKTEIPEVFIAIVRDISDYLRAEEALRESEARLRNILHNSPAPIYLKDTKGRFLVANSQYEKNYEVKFKDLQGKTSLEVFQDEHGKQYFDHDMEVLKAQETIVREEQRGGRTFVTLKFPILTEDGKLIGLGGIETDITERKHLEQELRLSRELFSQAFHSNPSLIALTNLDTGVHIDVNEAWQNTLKYSREEATGKTAFELNLWSDTGERERILKEQDKYGRVRDFVARFKAKDGTLIDCSISTEPIKMDNQELLLWSANDITKRMQIEHQLTQAKDEAEKANNAKSEFLASMSHELRTPLNAVLGFAQMLQIDSRTPLSPAQDVHVKSILDGGNHLLELVNEILDLVKIEANQLDLSLSDVEVNELVADCVSLITPLGELRNIMINDQFSNGKSILLFTDHTRLKQILINLLSNAVKFNKDGGTVTVEGQETENGYLRISVADTGVGIAKEDNSNVFNLFHRLDANPMIAREGTGIGLTVSKTLVERLAGRIGFESEEGVGSTFWIDLPLASNEDVLIWTEAMNIGVDAMDKDHQILISMLNRVMHRSVSDADIDEIISELLDYSRYHFEREEAVMEACAFPGFEKHRDLHRELIADVRDRTEAWRKKHDQDSLVQFRSFLKGWAFDHILNEDTKIMSSAKGKGEEIREALERLG